MTFNRFCAGALLAATALTCAAPASAQRIDRIVAFGDSYADDGNLWQFLGIAPPSAFPTGRFSGGTNYIDTLGFILGAPIDNFAIGGALTSNNNTVAGPVLGFPTEYLSFLAGGGGPAFPSVSGTFGEGDLLAISIGGNDARVYTSGGGTVAGAPAAAAVAVANATAGLNALVGAGAPTISFLAGDTSRMPEVAGNAPAQAVRTAFASAFNGGIQAPLAGYAADGVMVHYLDLTLVGDRIVADPTAYGLKFAGACAPAPACVGDASLNGQYLFYVDGIHLSSAGFKIVAQYIAAQLTAPLTLQATSDVALDTARQFGRTLTTRMDLGAPRDGDMPEGLGVYVTGDYSSRKLKPTDTNLRFDVTSVGATVGVEYGFGSGLIGAAANLSRPKANFTSDAASTKSKSVQLGIYGAAGIAGGFVQGYAGYGWDDHEIERAAVIDELEANVDGRHSLAGFKAGYLMPMGSVRVGPVLGLDYARAKVDGYTEEGDAALTLNVDRQSYRSLRGSLGAEVRGDFAGGGVQLRPYAAAVVEKDFTGDGRTFTFSQTSAPTIVNRFEVADGSKKAYGRFSAGFSAAILEGISLDVAGSATARKKQGNETSAHVGLRASF